MKIFCNRLEISDDDLGIEITFNENEKDEPYDGGEIRKLIDSLGTYVLLQRSYPEDEFDRNYYYIEFSDFDKSGELIDFTITLTRKKLQIDWEGDFVEIELNVNNHKIDELKNALKIFTNFKGKLVIIE